MGPSPTVGSSGAPFTGGASIVGARLKEMYFAVVAEMVIVAMIHET